MRTVVLVGPDKKIKMSLTVVSDDDAKKKFPGGWKAPTSYLRIVPQPRDWNAEQRGALAMTESSPARNPETSLTRDLLDAARYYLRGRRSFIILAGVAIVGGLAFSWSWLVAAGIAPVLLTLLPCAAMCALGLCMNRMGGRSCAQDAAPRDTTQAASSDETEVLAQSVDPRPVAPAITGDREPAAILLTNTQPRILEERRIPDA